MRHILAGDDTRTKRVTMLACVNVKSAVLRERVLAEWEEKTQLHARTRQPTSKQTIGWVYLCKHSPVLMVPFHCSGNVSFRMQTLHCKAATCDTSCSWLLCALNYLPQGIWKREIADRKQSFLIERRSDETANSKLKQKPYPHNIHKLRALFSY